jgi:hypothetical protein
MLIYVEMHGVAVICSVEGYLVKNELIILLAENDLNLSFDIVE